jgi:RNA-directed DNA polymerase
MTQNDGSQKQLCLKKAADLRIERHVKISGTANPFDARYEKYFEKRTALKMADRLSGRRKLLAIRRRQKGRCLIYRE